MTSTIVKQKNNNNKKDKEKEKREGMCNAVLGFEVHVTKIQEGKTICPYLAITKETSVFQGYFRGEGETNKGKTDLKNADRKITKLYYVQKKMMCMAVTLILHITKLQKIMLSQGNIPM